MQDITQNFDPRDISETKPLAWLSYLSILFLIPMLIHKNSPFVKFHVNQGIVLVLFAVIFRVIGGVLGVIPLLDIFSVLFSLLSVAVGILSLIGFITALMGKAQKLPVIGNIIIYK